MSIEVKIKKSFKDFELNEDFRTDKKSLGILGASGCGKSMMLKCIAGIETPDYGRIVLDGRVLFDSEKKINLSPQKRKIGFLFQNYALFPTMTVLKNVESGIEEKDRKKREQKARALIEQIGLKGLENRYPDQLSGGQQQRAALTRMLAAEPEMILLDEPFSALDAYLKDALLQEMKGILEHFQGHVMIVSHNREELYRLCGEMAVMDDGQILRIDTVKAVFDRPEFVQAARLTGCKNISEIQRLGDYKVLALKWGITFQTADKVPEDVTHVGIRAHHLIPADAETVNSFPVQLEEISESPFEFHYFMKNVDAPEKLPIWWKVPKSSVHAPAELNMPKFLTVKPEEVMLLKE